MPLRRMTDGGDAEGSAGIVSTKETYNTGMKGKWERKKSIESMNGLELMCS